MKRELKLRGLPLNGNKNELQDRLQTALLEGDISLEDSAIADAIVDAIDDDVSLTDEDEHKLLGDDHEDLLLKSPVSTPTATTLPELTTATTPSTASTESKSEANATLTPGKKIVLKRNNSQPSATTLTAGTAPLSKENAAPEAEANKDSTSQAEESTTKTQRKPIVIGGGAASAENKDATRGADKKLNQLSIQERLELRAKKFGIPINPKAATDPATGAAAAAPPAVNKSSSASIKANKGNKETEEQQKEALKRRAERFGCVVPEKNAKTLANERLLKRKERFGGAATEAASTTEAGAAAAVNTKGEGVWAEKAKARLERFKTTPVATVADTEK